MPQITIGPQFFRNEARSYGNVKLAIARELLQNAVDAGAKHIDIEIASTADGTDLLFSDDGTGMSREVLENVFFSLGATTKNTGATTGGMGVARQLVCFCQRSYEIRTRDMLVKGSGADFDIIDGLPEIKGCLFRIQIAWAELDISPRELLDAFRSYLGMSQLTAEVTISGEKFKSWCYRRSVERTLSFGTVHVNKTSGHRNRLLVRTNSLLMYSLYHQSPVQVVLEIDPSRSREVLLSNRDSLKQVYREELDKFVQEISTDTLSAFRDNNAPKTQILAGNARQFRAPSSSVETYTETAMQVDCGPQGYVSANMPCSGIRSNSPVLSGYLEQHDPVTDGLVILTKTNNNAALVRASRLFTPANWNGVHGAKRRKLLLQWIIACEAALESFCRLTCTESIAWRPGFVIDPDMEAANQKQPDGSFALMFNPVECRDGAVYSIGNIKYKLKEWESTARLLTLAAHEVTHCHPDCKYHSESFSSKFTEIMADCAARLPEIHRAMVQCL